MRTDPMTCCSSEIGTPRAWRPDPHSDDAMLEAVSIEDRRIARAEFSDVFAPMFSPPEFE